MGMSDAFFLLPGEAHVLDNVHTGAVNDWLVNRPAEVPAALHRLHEASHLGKIIVCVSLRVFDPATASARRHMRRPTRTRGSFVQHT